MSNKEHGNYVQLLKCSSAVVCKSLNFRSSKSNFSLQYVHSSFENWMNPLNNKQMMLI